MVTEQTAQRMTELADAFRAFQRSVPGLTVEVVGHVAGEAELVHPVAGFHVRLPGQEGVGGIQLYISASYAELIRWGDAGAIRERFNVQLSDEFGWGDSVFPHAEGLAHDLLAYLQFNLDVVTR